MATISKVPEQVGGVDESVLKPGPWSRTLPKAHFNAIDWEKSLQAKVKNIEKCSGAGDIKFTAIGKPSDNDVYKTNRIHEDNHASDDKIAFEAVVGKWDKNLQEAKDKRWKFGGATAGEAEDTLFAFMGGTPDEVAEQFYTATFESGEAFHLTAKGKSMWPYSIDISKDCSLATLVIERGYPPAEL